MDVTQPRLLEAERTGSTFPQNVSIHCPTQYIIPQYYSLHLHSCQNLTTHTFPKLLQSTLWDLRKLQLNGYRIS